MRPILWSWEWLRESCSYEMVPVPLMQRLAESIQHLQRERRETGNASRNSVREYMIKENYYETKRKRYCRVLRAAGATFLITGFPQFHRAGSLSSVS
jgi:hypothetical protein